MDIYEQRATTPAIWAITGKEWTPRQLTEATPSDFIRWANRQTAVAVTTYTEFDEYTTVAVIDVTPPSLPGVNVVTLRYEAEGPAWQVRWLITALGADADQVAVA